MQDAADNGSKTVTRVSDWKEIDVPTGLGGEITGVIAEYNSFTGKSASSAHPLQKLTTPRCVPAAVAALFGVAHMSPMYLKKLKPRPGIVFLGGAREALAHAKQLGQDRGMKRPNKHFDYVQKAAPTPGVSNVFEVVMGFDSMLRSLVVANLPDEHATGENAGLALASNKFQRVISMHLEVIHMTDQTDPLDQQVVMHFVIENVKQDPASANLQVIELNVLSVQAHHIVPWT